MAWIIILHCYCHTFYHLVNCNINKTYLFTMSDAISRNAFGLCNFQELLRKQQIRGGFSVSFVAVVAFLGIIIGYLFRST